MNRFYNAKSINYTKSNIESETLTSFPRIFLETIGFGLIALVVLYLVFKYPVSDIWILLGILSMFVMGLYKTYMPSKYKFISYSTLL